MKLSHTAVYSEEGLDRKWILMTSVTSQAPSFTSDRVEITFNAPDQCGWHSGRDFFSDDYFVPAENAVKGNEIKN